MRRRASRRATWTAILEFRKFVGTTDLESDDESSYSEKRTIPRATVSTTGNGRSSVPHKHLIKRRELRSDLSKNIPKRIRRRFTVFVFPFSGCFFIVVVLFD